MLILGILGELSQSLEGRRANVDPMNFGRTKVNPLKVEELLLILQCVGKLLSILWILGELRSIP